MKNFKRVLAGVLTATVLSTAVSVTGVSALTKTNTDSVKKSSSKIADSVTKNEQSYVEGEAVIMMKGTGVLSSGSKLSQDVEDVSKDIKVEDVETFNDKRNGCTVATVSSNKLSTDELVSQLNDSDDIEIAEPNYIYKALAVTDDTYSKFQWSLDANGQNGGETDIDVNAQELWNTSTTSTEEQVVAIVDTGVDYTHEDLKDKMWVNPYQNKLSGVYGYDFTGNNKDNSPMDNNGHGTHCAGIIGAEQNNQTGISGVSQNTKIMALKTLGADGSGDLTSFVSAYNYIYKAMKLGVNVVAVNNSWGANANSEILLKLINKVGNLGALSICAAGNDSVNFDEEINLEDYYEDYGDSDIAVGSVQDVSNPYANSEYPACYDSEYVITVASTDEYGEIAPYSCYGTNTVDISAPGSDILSTVSYNAFNPNLYSDVDSKCSLYETNNFTVVQNDMGKGIATISEGTDKYFSDYSDDKTSLEWKINGAKSGDVYTFEIPYTAEDTAQNPWVSARAYVAKCPEISDDDLEEASYYGNYNRLLIKDVSADEKIDYTNLDSYVDYVTVYEQGDYWYGLRAQTTNKNAGERKLVFELAISFDGDYTINLDNIAISKGSKNEEESFGKYDYMTGTSMATPAVTGSIALIKEKYPEMTTEEIADVIKGSVNQREGFEDKVISAGTTDLSKIKNLVPSITDISVVDNKATITGKNLANGKVTVNGNSVATSSVTDNKIVIKDTSFINSACAIKVTTENGYAVKNTILQSGTKYTDIGIMSSYFFDNTMASDGKYVYYVDSSGTVKKLGLSDLSVVTTYENGLDEYFEPVVNGSSYMYDISNVICYNNYLYINADLYLLTNETENAVPYSTESVIEKLNLSTGESQFIDYSEDIKEPTIAVYNGTLYLIGGIVNGEVSQNVYKYSSSKWVNATALPSGRAMGKCVQVNNTQMVYTLGTDGTSDVPKNLIFDGSKWTESKASLTTTSALKTEIDGKEFTYYDGGVSLISGGLLYTGILYDGYGDTVKYTVSTDKFSNYSKYFKTKNTDIIRGLVVNNKFYGTSCQLVEVEDYDYATDEIVTTAEIFSKGYSFGVTSGMYTISANASHGKVSGTGAYYPGETVTLKATANKNYKVKSITVNGKTYNKNTVTFKATKSTKVTVKYTSLVSSIKLSSTNKTLNLKKNKTFNLTAKINPTGATNKTLNWKNSKSTVVTMKKVNNTTVKLTAKKKGTAVITASAKDGSKKSAKCTVKVK